MPKKRNKQKPNLEMLFTLPKTFSLLFYLLSTFIFIQSIFSYSWGLSLEIISPRKCGQHRSGMTQSIALPKTWTYLPSRLPKHPSSLEDTEQICAVLHKASCSPFTDVENKMWGQGACPSMCLVNSMASFPTKIQFGARLVSYHCSVLPT